MQLFRSSLAGVAAALCLGGLPVTFAGVSATSLIGSWEGTWVYVFKQAMGGAAEQGAAAEPIEFECLPGGFGSLFDFQAQWKQAGSSYVIDASAALLHEYAPTLENPKALLKATGIKVLNPGTTNAGLSGKLKYRVTGKSAGYKLKVVAKGSLVAWDA